MIVASGPEWELLERDSLIWLREAAGESVDAIITDPPYSSGGQFRGDRAALPSEKYQQGDAGGPEYPEFYGDTRDQRGYLAWCSLWLADAWRITRPGGALVVFADWRMLPTMTDAIQAGGWIWRGIVPWTKPNARRQLGRFAAQCEYALWGSKGPMPWERGVAALPGFLELPPGGELAILPGWVESNSVPKDDRLHLTEKPVAVMRKLVRIAPPGALICDPFSGAGSTGVGALLERRRYRGVELSSEYNRRASDRLRALERHEHHKDAERGQIGLFAGQEQRDGD